MDSARRKDSSWVHYVFLKKRKGRLFLLEVVFMLKCICINHMLKLVIFTRNLLLIIDQDDIEVLQYYLQFSNIEFAIYMFFCFVSPHWESRQFIFVNSLMCVCGRRQLLSVQSTTRKVVYYCGRHGQRRIIITTLCWYSGLTYDCNTTSTLLLENDFPQTYSQIDSELTKH